MVCALTSTCLTLLKCEDDGTCHYRATSVGTHSKLLLASIFLHLCSILFWPPQTHSWNASSLVSITHSLFLHPPLDCYTCIFISFPSWNHRFQALGIWAISPALKLDKSPWWRYFSTWRTAIEVFLTMLTNLLYLNYMVPASPSDSVRAAILIPPNLKANVVPHCLVHPTLPVNTYKSAQGQTHAHVHSFTMLEIKPRASARPGTHYC